MFGNLEIVWDSDFRFWNLNHPLLYEINARWWLAELSERTGQRVTLLNVPESEFEFWRQRGFTHIWLMGVWATGPRSREVSRELFRGEHAYRDDDIAGSSYAIQQYTVPPVFGGDEALAAFRSRLHQHGLKLILDFVPNHVALDHPWAETKSEFFVTGSCAGGFAAGCCGRNATWKDTLQLDYRNPELRAAMVRELIKVSARCDGVRCDMAMLVLNEVFARTWRDVPSAHVAPPTEFWAEAIAATRQRHQNFIFLAEVYWASKRACRNSALITPTTSGFTTKRHPAMREPQLNTWKNFLPSSFSAAFIFWRTTMSRASPRCCRSRNIAPRCF